MLTPEASTRSPGSISAVDPAQDGSNSRHQLPRAERLGDVVVRADLQPEDPVEFVVAGGQHQDRHRGFAAQRPGHVQAVHAGQAEVQHEHVRLSGARRLQGRGSVRGGQHREAGMLEVVASKLDDARFVVDDEDCLHGSLMLRLGGLTRAAKRSAERERRKAMARALRRPGSGCGGSAGRAPGRSCGGRLRAVRLAMPLLESLPARRLPALAMPAPAFRATGSERGSGPARACGIPVAE